MRKRMEKLASKLNNRVMYFTENQLDFGGYEDCKYFLCWLNTHKIYRAAKTQAECVECLEDLIEEKIVWEDAHGFTVVKE